MTRKHKYHDDYYKENHNTLEERSPLLHSPPIKWADKKMTTENEKPEVVHNYWISFLCVLFGLGTWLPVNAVYSQLPIFVQFAPEGWNLPSYISLLIQCANIAPLLWYFFHDKFIRKQSIIICFFLSLGTVSLFCLAFTYRIQYLILGTMHSIYFFLFTFCVALVGCVSSVLFLPFMNKLPELYLVPYFIGEGLSGLIPSVIALVQGVGRDQKCVNITTPTGVKLEKVAEEPYFGSTLFLVISGCFMLLSTLSFFYLNYVSNFIQPPTSVSDFIQLPVDSSESPKQQRSNSVTSITPINLTKTLFAVLLLAQTLINCFSNGILPSIQSYSCLPYGREAYHWSVNLNQIINPIIIYSAFYLPVISLRVLAACGAVQIMCLVYELLTAFTSPVPPLVGTTVGVVLIVFTWMLGSALISYMKLSIASIFRRKHQKGLINYGLVTQLGSAAGSVISFILINYLKLFQSVPEDKCQP